MFSWMKKGVQKAENVQLLAIAKTELKERKSKVFWKPILKYCSQNLLKRSSCKKLILPLMLTKSQKKMAANFLRGLLIPENILSSNTLFMKLIASYLYCLIII